MKRTTVFLLTAFAMIASSETQALRISEAVVLSERTSESMRKCQLSAESQSAAVEAALRNNRISLGSRETTKPSFYVSSAAVEMTSNACAVTSRLEVMYYASVPVLFPSDKKTTYAKIVLCNETGILSGPKYDLQGRLSNMLKEFVDLCLSEIEKQR